MARTLTSSYRVGYYMHSEFVEQGAATQAIALAAPSSGEVAEACPGSSAPEASDWPAPRFYTPRECARLMGFPETFRLDGVRNPNRIYHQVRHYPARAEGQNSLGNVHFKLSDSFDGARNDVWPLAHVGLALSL